MPEKNKVKFNLKNCAWASRSVSNGTVTYGTVKKWPGAVSVSFEADGDEVVFWADGVKYYSTHSNNGYSGDFESAIVPDEFRKEILGELTDANGVMVEKALPEDNHFAFMWEFDGDKTGRRHVFYDCTCSRASLEGKTTEGSNTPETEKLKISAAPVEMLDSNGETINVPKASATKADAPTAYESWFSSVYLPDWGD